MKTLLRRTLRKAIFIPAHGAFLRLPASAGTWKGFRQWAQSEEYPDKAKVSFINSHIYIDMSPEEIETHNKVKKAVAVGVCTLNEKIDAGEYFDDGVMLANARAGLLTVSDGTFVKWETSASGKVRFIPRKDREGEFIEIQGTPDWVLEVVSSSSIEKDTVELPVTYHRAGIPEFLLIDARGPVIDFQLLIHRRSKYVAAQAQGGWFFSPVFQRWFRLVRSRNRQGRWTYRLESKS